MPYTTNVEAIYNALIADATLLGTLGINGYSGIARGGVYNRPLRREGPEPTEHPFYQNKNGRAIRPCVIVLDRGDRKHPQALQIPGSYVNTILIQFYALATQTGKDTIAAMRKRVYEIIDHDASGFIYTLEDGGPVCFPRIVDRFGIHDSEAFQEAVEDYQRYEITSRYAHIV